MSKPTDESILVANESFSSRYEGADHAFVKGTTRVRAGHPILKGIEHLFVPITPHYEAPAYTADEIKAAADAKEAAAAVREEKAKAEQPEFETATQAPNEKRGK